MAAEEIVKLLTKTTILAEIKNLPYYVLNVNIPDLKSSKDIKGRMVTRLGHSLIARPVHNAADPRGRDAYWFSLRKCQHTHSESVHDLKKINHHAAAAQLSSDDGHTTIYTDN